MAIPIACTGRAQLGESWRQLEASPLRERQLQQMAARLPCTLSDNVLVNAMHSGVMLNCY